MYVWRCYALLLIAVLSQGCLKRNKNVCCVSEADCASVGYDIDQVCDPGLACVDHRCIAPLCSSDAECSDATPTCRDGVCHVCDATHGCPSTTPLCDETSDTCGMCVDNASCMSFPDAPMCDPSNGACVECLQAGDCPTTEPICDAGTCRACRADSECASEACADEGSCVQEGEIVYVATDGVDAGECTKTAPCKKIAFAIGKTGNTRRHVVIRNGTYGESLIRYNNATSQADQLWFHGSNSKIEIPAAAGDVFVFQLDKPTTIQDLTIDVPSGAGITAYSTIRARRMSFRVGIVALSSGNEATFEDITCDDIGTGATAYCISLQDGGRMTLDRATLKGGLHAIHAPDDFGVTANISNVVAYGSRDAAFHLPKTAGSISFVTIANSGGTAAAASALNCAPNATLMSVRSSIFWTPGAGSKAPIVGGCGLMNVDAGPVAVPGASSANPLFQDLVGNDLHLAPNSPMKDVVDDGPGTDFEGDARPLGPRFDIGADEAQ